MGPGAIPENWGAEGYTLVGKALSRWEAERASGKTLVPQTAVSSARGRAETRLGVQCPVGPPSPRTQERIIDCSWAFYRRK